VPTPPTATPPPDRCVRSASGDPIATRPTTLDQLREAANQIDRLVGTEWRHDAAAEMGVTVDDVGIGPVGQTRDSGTLDRSNFRVVHADLTALDDRVHTRRFRHWGVGWVENVAVPLDNAALVDRIAHWAAKLDSYPVADESDLAALEAEDIDHLDAG
jgi:hypothetical protein